MDKTSNNLILIAEDSPTQAENLKFILENNGYKVAHGLNGQETLKLLKKHKPLLIISDILMPVMDGYELCRHVRADENLKQVPVILLTSLTEAEDVLKGLECGADSYVMKPFNEQHLMSRIQSILASKASLGDEKVKQESIDVLFAGKKYFVNSTRFQILNMLLSTYEGAVQKTQKLTETQAALSVLRTSLEKKVEEKTEYLQLEIKERQQVETAIKASEKKYRNLVENALVGVFSSTMEGRLYFVNEAFCTILQYDSFEELTSRTFQSLCNTPNDYIAFLETLRKNRQVQNFEIELVSNSGQTKWVIVNALLKGEILLGMILDITERKKTEEKEKKYQDELRVAKEKAEESDRLKSTFLSNMSHEIRTPMNVITGFSSLLSEPGISTENRIEFVNRISVSCYSLLNLIENILDIAKLEAGKLKIYEKKCTLNQLLTNIYSTFSKEKRINGKDQISVRLQTTIQEKDFTILADPFRIYQILSNLLDNAFKFTEKGSIEFGYTVQGDTLQFFVKLIKIVARKGYNRFEWVLNNSKNEDFFVEVTMYYGKEKGKSLLYIFLQDINQKKKNKLLMEWQKNEIIQKSEEIETQRDEISAQKKEITDSINYAQRIQYALLPKNDVFRKIFSDYFIFYRPKDIVSGDFYWISNKNGKTVIAASDCTGHGVPGAFMSILGVEFLNEIVNNIGIVQPNRILNNMRDRIIKTMGQTGKAGETGDGMDIALVSIDIENYTLQYAGAFNPLFIIKNNNLSEIKGDRMPLGFYKKIDKPFTNHEIQIKSNDSIYLFSDGYKDQFGWRSDKKFNMNNFRELLLSVQNVPMKAQKLLLENNLKNWMGDMEQIDDIMVVGLRI